MHACNLPSGMQQVNRVQCCEVRPVNGLTATRWQKIAAWTLNPITRVKPSTIMKTLPQLQLDKLRCITKHLQDIDNTPMARNLLPPLETPKTETMASTHINNITVKHKNQYADYDEEPTPLEVFRLIQGDSEEVLHVATPNCKTVKNRKRLVKI